MVTTKIICSCGMDNQLVRKADGWHYDEKKHGNGEPANGKCFNCHAPLKEFTPSKSASEKSAPDKEPEKETEKSEAEKSEPKKTAKPKKSAKKSK